MSAMPYEIAYAPWSEWDPVEYLAEYYTEVMPDERFALEFLAGSTGRMPPAGIALDFGCGPTVHHLFPLVPKVSEFHVAEYLPANRAEVNKWVMKAEDAFDWRGFAMETLRLEGCPAPTGNQARERERETRTRITRVLPGDAGDADPLGPAMRGFYPLVTSHYCAEGATESKVTWARYMRNIASLVMPGGIFILSACGSADYYAVGERRFPCAGINGGDILRNLEENGFMDIDLRIRQVQSHAAQGYGSVIFACAVKAG